MEKWEKEIAKQFKETYNKMEDAFLKDTKAIAKEQEEMLKKLKKHEISRKEFSKWRIAEEKYLQQHANELADYLSLADKYAVDRVNKELPQYYAEAMNQQLWQVERYGIKTDFGLVNADAVSQAVRGKYFRKIDTKRNTAYNRRRIRSAITAGVLRGSSIPDIAKSLRPLVNGNAKSALLNARTWVNSVENGGHYDEAVMLDAAGVHMKKMWLSAGDDKVRDSHRELDQEERDIDEAFSNGGQYPCDPALDAEEYYNCRCTILNYVQGYAPDLSKRNMDLGGKSYEEWKHGKQLEKQIVDYYGTEDFTSYIDFGDNTSESEHWHSEHNYSQDKWDALPNAEANAVRRYTGSAFQEMNRALRGRITADDDVQKLINNCTKALDKMEVADNCVVYRGMGSERTMRKLLGLPETDKYGFDLDFTDKNLLSSMKGMRFTEKGFMSTGVNEDASWSGVHLKIYIPKGTKGMYVDPISQFRGEDELLLQRNTTLEIMDANHDGGKLNIIAKVVSQKR